MISIPAGSRIYLACGHTDMRKGFDSLAALVQQVLTQDPYSGALFAFKGRRGDLIKLLWWDTQGLCLFASFDKLTMRAAGEGAVCLAGDGDGKRRAVAGAIIDAAGRDRLARACAELEAGIGGLKISLNRPVLLAFLTFYDTSFVCQTMLLFFLTT